MRLLSKQLFITIGLNYINNLTITIGLISAKHVSETISYITVKNIGIINGNNYQ